MMQHTIYLWLDGDRNAGLESMTLKSAFTEPTKSDAPGVLFWYANNDKSIHIQKFLGKLTYKQKDGTLVTKNYLDGLEPVLRKLATEGLPDDNLIKEYVDLDSILKELYYGNSDHLWHYKCTGKTVDTIYDLYN